MADQNSNSSSPQVIVVPAAAAPAATPAAPAAQEDGKEKITLTSKQLEKRLSEERDRGARRLMKDLGIDEKEAREEAVEKIRKGLYGLTERRQIEAEQKTAMEALQAKAKRADDFEPLVMDMAKKEFDGLPEGVQKFVTAQAGDNAIARYNMIKAMRDTGALQSMAAAAPAATEAPKIPKPATTVATEPSAAPTTGTDLDEYQTWRQLAETGQKVAAANYLARNQSKIYTLADKHSK